MIKPKLCRVSIVLLVDSFRSSAKQNSSSVPSRTKAAQLNVLKCTQIPIAPLEVNVWVCTGFVRVSNKIFKCSCREGEAIQRQRALNKLTTNYKPLGIVAADTRTGLNSRILPKVNIGQLNEIHLLS